MNEQLNALKANNDRLYMVLMEVVKSGCIDNNEQLLEDVNNTLGENPIISLKSIKLWAVEFVVDNVAELIADKAGVTNDIDKLAILDHKIDVLLAVSSFANMNWGVKG
jgi:hypothetical protein